MAFSANKSQRICQSSQPLVTAQVRHRDATFRKKLGENLAPQAGPRTENTRSPSPRPGLGAGRSPTPNPLPPTLSNDHLFSPGHRRIAAAAGQCNSAVQRTSRRRGPSSALPVAGRHLVRKWRPLGASFVGGVQQTLPSACAERRLSASASRSGVQQIPPSACAERRCQRRLLLT